MAERRFAPVRPIARGPFPARDSLDRGLAAVVERARAAERLAARDPGPLGPRLAELEAAARDQGLEAVLADALALAAVASERLVGRTFEVAGEPLGWELRPRDNQLACAAALAAGRIAELDTGEGKTLSVAIAAAASSLVGRVHVVTANDYLARRDFEWMGPLLAELGVSVGLVHHGVPEPERRRAYLRKVTYVSVKELGADYLRDTLGSERAGLLLPGLEAALLDEVDFILVDEARVPLILAEQIDPAENLAHQFNAAVAGMVDEQRGTVERLHEEIERLEREPGWDEQKRRFETTVRLAMLLLADPLDPKLESRLARAVEAGDPRIVRRARDTILRYQRLKRRDELVSELLYTVDRKALAVQLTERGLDRLVESFGDLFADPGEDPEAQLAHRARVRAVHNLVAAHVLHRRDRDYIVEGGRVVLVDSSTGRPSFDRHLQHGLHRAIEAKEGLYPALDHRTAAEITFPGLFQLYERWAGTSGTCLELARIFKSTFRKEVVRVPPHRPSVRVDFEDALFASFDDKLLALVAEVETARRLRQPVLVGTDSVEVSELVGEALARAGLPHEVLNARHHAEEARIIARAGEPGAVTVATAMAGRGTDVRTPDELDRTIAAAAASWAGEALAAGSGLRLEVRTEAELATLRAALEARGLPFRLGIRAGARTVDLGAAPPTAFPLTLGMRVIGFERLVESRLDRQLRGRTGRQGAPGSTRFYIALDDETVLVHGDRPRIAELGRKAARRLDPLSGRPVRSHAGLLEAAQRAYATQALLVERGRERLRALDAVDQGQREHYDSERRVLLFAGDGEISRLADEALERAARDLVGEALGGDEHLGPERMERLDDLSQILFERRGLLEPLLADGSFPAADRAAAALGEALARLYGVTRSWHGRPAMAAVERTVLLDALTGSWRRLSGERPELREQAELYAYAGKKPADVYRAMAGKAYHAALSDAARTAASVLVTFPLPREVKTARTGLRLRSGDVLEALGLELPPALLS